jgi:hypothetical protein
MRFSSLRSVLSPIASICISAFLRLFRAGALDGGRWH